MFLSGVANMPRVLPGQVLYGFEVICASILGYMVLAGLVALFGGLILSPFTTSILTGKSKSNCYSSI